MHVSNQFQTGLARRGNLGNRVDALTNEQLMSMAPSIFAADKHESRSARYTYIPTIEVVDGLRQNGFVPVSATQGRCRIAGKEDFTKHLIRFRSLSDDTRERGLGALYPEVALLNSHDGTSRYKLMAGMLRLACLNGMLVADHELGSVSVSHKGDIVGQVIEGSFTVIEESRRAIEVGASWAQIGLSDSDRDAFAESAHVLRFGDAEGNVTTAIEPRQLLVPRRNEDRGNDLWRTFNRVQEAVIAGGLSAVGRDTNGRSRRTTTRPVRGIDQDVRLNRALWLLGERMAELKSAA